MNSQLSFYNINHFLNNEQTIMNSYKFAAEIDSKDCILLGEEAKHFFENTEPLDLCKTVNFSDKLTTEKRLKTVPVNEEPLDLCSREVAKKSCDTSLIKCFQSYRDTHSKKETVVTTKNIQNNELQSQTSVNAFHSKELLTAKCDIKAEKISVLSQYVANLVEDTHISSAAISETSPNETRLCSTVHLKNGIPQHVSMEDHLAVEVNDTEINRDHSNENFDSGFNASLLSCPDKHIALNTDATILDREESIEHHETFTNENRVSEYTMPQSKILSASGNTLPELMDGTDVSQDVTNSHNQVLPQSTIVDALSVTEKAKIYTSFNSSPPLSGQEAQNSVKKTQSYCSTCSTNFKSLWNLKRHRQGKHCKNRPLDLCTAFGEQENFIDETAVKNSVAEASSSDNLQRFTRIEDSKEQVQSYTYGTNHSFDSILRQCLIGDPKACPYICPLCKESFMMAYALDQHMLLIHKASANSGGNIVKKFSESNFNLEHEFSRQVPETSQRSMDLPVNLDQSSMKHISLLSSQLFNKRSSIKQSSEIKDINTAICARRNSTSADNRKLTNDQEDAGDELCVIVPSSLSVCDENSDSRKDHENSKVFQIHLNNLKCHYLSVKRHVCSICRKRFEHLSQLKSHFYSHVKNRPICKICRKSFSTQGNLNMHVMLHSGIKPYECLTCQKCFSRKAQLELHVLTHSQAKPFKCMACPNKYAQKNDLQNHFAVHLGVKPHECQLCFKRFTFRSSFNYHIRKHHSNQKLLCQ